VALDLATISYFVSQSLTNEQAPLGPLTLAFGAYVLADFCARLWIARRKLRFLLSLPSIADMIVMVSMLAPLIADNLGFLRVARMLRLLRSYHVLRDLRTHWPWFRRHEEIIESAVNLFVFLFLVTSLVYVFEANDNPDIDNFLDALYFTVTTLTTTGFGDITMRDTEGRLIAVVIMVFGVALFLRLVQTLFRPVKAHFTCPTCGLNRHDPDAIHCKHCGETVNIPTHGEW